MPKWRQSLAANKVKFVDHGKTTPASSWSIVDSNQERAISVKKVIVKSTFARSLEK
jgi:hypothetical protein